MRKSIRLGNLLALVGLALGAPSCADRVFDNPMDPNNPSSDFTIRANYPAPAGTVPGGLDFDREQIWIADQQRPSLSIVRASGGQNAGTLPLRSIAFGVTHDEALIWVTEPGSLARIFRTDGRMQDRAFPIPTSDPRGLDYDEEEQVLWVIDGTRRVILQVDPNGPVIAEIPCGQVARPGGLTFRDEELWVVDQEGSRLVQIDRSDGHELASHTLPIGNAVGLTSADEWFYYSETSGRIFAVELREDQARLQRWPRERELTARGASTTDSELEDLVVGAFFGADWGRLRASRTDLIVPEIVPGGVRSRRSRPLASLTASRRGVGIEAGPELPRCYGGPRFQHVSIEFRHTEASDASRRRAAGAERHQESWSGSPRCPESLLRPSNGIWARRNTQGPCMRRHCRFCAVSCAKVRRLREKESCLIQAFGLALLVLLGPSQDARIEPASAVQASRSEVSPFDAWQVIADALAAGAAVAGATAAAPGQAPLEGAGTDEPGEGDSEEDEPDAEAEAEPARPLVPLDRFLQESPHPVLVSISSDYMVYSAERKLLYARGNVRYSGRGFVLAAEAMRLDLGPQRVLFSSVQGVLRRGRETRPFHGDVLHLDMQQRRGVLTTYADRILTERLWFPRDTETRTSQLDLYFQELENGPIEAELGLIVEGRLYLEMQRVKIDPQSRLRAWGVQPYIEGSPGPRLPYFSFRTGDAQPREGLSIRSLGASNVSGIRADIAYSMSPAERLLTTFEVRYEELSLLNDPFRPQRRARFGLNQNVWLSDSFEAQAGGFYQTDEEWQGGGALEFQRGPHSASLAALIQNNPITGRHDRILARHAYEKEELRSELKADLDFGTELGLQWDFASRAWKDRFQIQGSSSYLKRFENGLYHKAEVLTTNTVASLNVANFLTTLSYFGVQDLELEKFRHNPAVSVETLPRSIGAGLLLSVGDSLQLSSVTDPTDALDFDRTQLNNEVWGVVQHVPIYFTQKLSYDARVRVSQRLLEGIEDETTLEALNTVTRRFGQVSFASLAYRYQTVRQTSSEWLTVGRVAQEIHANTQFRLDRKKQLFGQGRYSLTENAPLDAFLQFTGEFGPAWKGTLRSGFDFQRERFNVLDIGVSRDIFFGWMTITYRQVQNELSVEYIAKLF